MIYTLRLFRDTDGVAAVLTGPGTLALFGRVAVPAALLGDIAEQAAQVRRLQDAPLPSLEALGARVFAQLLPAPVGGFLSECPAGALTLQVDDALQGIPWDIGFDGRQFLGGKFLTTLQTSRTDMAGLAADAGAAPPHLLAMAARAREPDHQRQLTSMSYDLVDSTRLMARIGSERYSDLLERFHSTCAGIVTRWGGVAGDPQGNDGLMCYFGLPVAREDTAANALRAGLEIVGAVTALDCQVRIGVVTGPVVVKAKQPVGVAVHLAARLQSVADPGTVVVSESTRQIVRQQFEFARLDRVPSLKGIENPGGIYRLIGVLHRSHDEADRPAREVALVGRNRELAALLGYWAPVARTAAFSTVLVSGEAGIGKSRLVREFRGALVADQHRVLECRCVAEQSNSAFFPLIDLMLRRHKIRTDDAAQVTRTQLTEVLGAVPDAALCVAALMGLLGVPGGDGGLLDEFSAERRRQLIVQAVTAWLAGQARGGAMCLIVEDVHWIDPSTRALLAGLLQRKSTALLLLLTQRSDHARELGAGSAVPEIELKGLTPDAAYTMIVETCSDALLPVDIIQGLIEKSDGVPLFIEESTRMVLEAGSAGERAPGARIAVPSTLQDLLMARLDRMDSAKQLAQIASLLGREFAEDTLLSVLPHPDIPFDADRAEAGLKRLVDAGLLVCKSEPTDLRYYFRHALIRDAADQSLLARDRKRFHAAIAEVLLQRFSGTSVAPAETLAWHFSEAGNAVQALVHWEAAARQAMQRSAHEEAKGYLDRALDCADAGLSGAVRDRAELRLQLSLAGQLVATEGYGAERVLMAYQRAMELSRLLADDKALLKVLLGLEGYYFMRADFSHAHQMAAQAGELARQTDDTSRVVQCDWAIANILFHQGELVQAVAGMDTCRAGYEALPPRAGIIQDPGVMCLCYSSLAQWELGYADDALHRALAAVERANRLQHRFSQGEAYGFCALVHYFRGEFALALECATRSLKICEDGGFTVWLAHAKLMHGRMRAELGDPAQGIAEMQEGYAMWLASGAEVTRPLYLAMLAEAHALDHRFDAALRLAREARDLAAGHGERYYEAEIERLIGDLKARSGTRTGAFERTEIRSHFERALDLANERQLEGIARKVRLNLAHWQEACSG